MSFRCCQAEIEIVGLPLFVYVPNLFGISNSTSRASLQRLKSTIKAHRKPRLNHFSIASYITCFLNDMEAIIELVSYKIIQLTIKVEDNPSQCYNLFSHKSYLLTSNYLFSD